MTMPAGWYTDPTNGRQRYWDGSVWSEETVEAEPGQAYTPPSDDVLPVVAARRRRWVWPAAALVGLAIIALTVVVAHGGDGDEPAAKTDKHVLVGFITTKANNPLGLSAGDPCTAEDGYDDLRLGTQAVVKDGDGKLLSVGELGAGTAVSPSGFPRCKFSFSVPNLGDSDFYVLTISHRGEQSYSRADLEARNWTVDLELGI